MSGLEGLLVWTLQSRRTLRHREVKCLALGHTASHGRLRLEPWFLVSLFCGSLFSLLEGNKWLSESMHLLGPDLPTSSAIFKGCLHLTRPPKVLPLPHAESPHQSWTGRVTQNLAELLQTTGRQLCFLLCLLPPAPPPPRVSKSQKPGAGPPCHPTDSYGWIDGLKSTI